MLCSEKAFSKGSAESSLHGLQSAMVQIQKWTSHAWRLICLVITLPVASALLGELAHVGMNALILTPNIAKRVSM